MARRHNQGLVLVRAGASRRHNQGVWSPLALGAKLKLWTTTADAASLPAAGAAVGQWSDKSGNGKHLVQATAGNKPISRASSIAFDTTDDYLGVTTPGFTANMTVLAVVRRAQTPTTLPFMSDTGGTHFLCAANGAGGTSSAASASGTPTYTINGSAVVDQQAALFNAWPADVDVVLEANGADMSAWGGFVVGDFFSPTWIGLAGVKEIVCVDSPTAADLANLRAYLTARCDTDPLPAAASYVGRWFATASATQIVAETINYGARRRSTVTPSGTTLSLAFTLPIGGETDGAVVAVYLNGAASSLVTLTGTNGILNSVQIASGLTPGVPVNVELRIAGVTYDWRGAGVQILGITGGSEVAWPDTRPVAAFFGDSITAGMGGRAAGQTSAAGAGDVSYGSLYCDNKGYQPLIAGFGGTGVTIDGIFNVPKWWNGTTTANTPGFSRHHLLAAGGEAPARVFINLGTNDTGNAVPGATFKAAYKSLVQALQARYPSAAFYLMLPFDGAYSTEISATASEVGATYINTTGWSITYTDGTHPTVAGHASIAGLLATAAP